MTDKEIEQLRSRALTSLKERNPGQYFGPIDIFKEMQRIRKPIEHAADDFIQSFFRGFGKS